MRPFYTPHQLRHDQDDILFINDHWGEIKEAYFQVLEALKAPTIEQPETPAPEGTGCDCTWVNKTFIPTYFYITRDSSVADTPEEEIQEFFKNMVVAYEYAYGRERFSPLVKLDVDGDVYALPIPHVTGSNNLIVYTYSFTGIVDNSGYPDKYTPPFYNEMELKIYASSGVMHGNKISLTLHKDMDKEYLYLSHDNTETDPTPMTFKCLETIKPYVAEDKPDNTPDTPDDNTPEGVLTPYTLKASFTPDYWDTSDAKFAVYCIDTQTWKEATKVVDGVIYYVFTEEEAVNDRLWVFTRHNPNQAIGWESKWNQTADINITFTDTVIDTVQYIDTDVTTSIDIGKAYV